MLKPRMLHTGQWWDDPLTLVDGCTHVSAGCDHCWSEALARRFKRDWTPRFRADRLTITYHTRTPTVFAVWNDMLHECVDDSDIRHVFNVMADFERHLFMVLTKRAERINVVKDKAAKNIAVGVTVESQEHVGRVATLLQAWPGKTFASVEPMLGPVEFNFDSMFHCAGCGDRCKVTGTCVRKPLDLVICGGESGAGARPMHPDWARSLRDQCADAGVPFLFKQWGEFAPVSGFTEDGLPVDFLRMARVGRKRAGRVLDGQTHDGWFKE